MLSPAAIRDALAAGVIAARADDREALEQLEGWLTDVSAAEFLRIDGEARLAYESVLGPASAWSEKSLAGMPEVAVVIASMHPSGYVRERAVSRLDFYRSPLAHRALAARVDDHVGAVREPAVRAVLGRTALSQAADLVPILWALSGRVRGGDVVEPYLSALVHEHGEEVVWRTLRASNDRAVHRHAFRHSASVGLLTVEEAARDLPRERDQVVRRTLTHVIADSGSPEVVASALLRAGTAESRALGLVRLTAGQVPDRDARRLLTDSSLLVRLWARARWSEKGRNPEATYREIVSDAVSPVIRARAYRGIVESGGVLDHGALLSLVRSPEPALCRAGLELLVGHVVPADAPLLARLVEYGSSGVARRAADALTTLPPRAVDAAVRGLLTSHDPETRRRAWHLLRRVGDAWDRTLADLEMTFDDDESNAEGAREVVRAPVSGNPSKEQRARVERLLAGAPGQFRGIAFAAGLPVAEPLTTPAVAPVGAPPGVLHRAVRWVARRRRD
ncbi:HEAT repeat domain-containing protein [Luteimicrobium sp. NPDC057192]|uniref:HEAT repeat domain-containing protein n=1 Tax=Luteimicrobium sp. NPDC057192 TaxID=3346042 RepID=UPI00363E74C1